MNAGNIVDAFVSDSKWNLVPAKRLFTSSKEINQGMKESNRLALTMKGVINRSLDDLQGLQSSDYSVYQIFEKDDLVFKLIDLENIKTSRVGIVHERGIMSPAYIRVSACSNSIYPRFYYWYFFALYLTNIYNKLGGGVRQNLTAGDLLEIPVPLIDISLQKQVSAFLDRETQRIDSLIEEKQTFITLLKEKRQALISHVVTKGLNPNVEMQDSGIEWIGQVPKHWVVKKIKYDVLGIEQGWSPQCESTPVTDDHTWGVVKVGCVNRGIFNPEQNKKLPEELEPRKEYAIKKGDLLVSRANAKEWVGSAAVPDRDYDNLLLCDKIYRIKLDLEKADPEFFAYYLASDQAREQIEIDATGTSSSMLNIGQGTILNMPIPAPELPEQQSIVRGIKNKTSQIDRLMLEVLDSIELLKEHRTSLISAAVTGKIDVREAV